MDGIKWLFFDLGSTLIDETDCYRFRCDGIVNTNNIDRQTFVDKVLEIAKENSFAIKSAADSFGFDIPKWPTELEKLYPDADIILKTLSKKYKLGIIANQSAGTQERIDDWGIGKYFDVVVASYEEGYEKPDLKIFKIALDRANCTPSEAVMIGDRLDNDIIPAKSLGMKTIWVKQGFAKYQTISDERQQPDIIIDTINNLIDSITNAL
jgi:HAD superfamily hydrolase (TIGR01662 family)